MSGKFASDRDSSLYALTLDGWSNHSDGDSNDYGLWFAVLNITPDDTSNTDAPVPVTDDMVGSFVITEDSQGFVTVTEYDEYRTALGDYRAMESDYADWLDASES